jgi:hypothetical protein
VVTGTELARRIELVLGDGAKALAIREGIKGLKERAQAAASKGGYVERNLRDFVKMFQAPDESGHILHETRCHVEISTNKAIVENLTEL